MRRRSAGRVAALAWLCAGTASPASAQTLEDLILDALNANVLRQAGGALAVLGLTFVPSETAGTLQFNGENRDSPDFLASQLGGSFTVSDSFPLYLEGFLGYTR